MIGCVMFNVKTVDMIDQDPGRLSSKWDDNAATPR